MADEEHPTAYRNRLLDSELAKAGISDLPRWRHHACGQSLLFMVEIIPVIHRLYDHLGRNVSKTVLDVGPQTGVGTQLLAEIHHPESTNNLKLEVAGLDNVSTWKPVFELLAPGLEYIVADVYNVQRKWDCVIASHVIEHVPKPHYFVRRLQEIANDFVIIACPWNENPIVTESHVNTIDKKFVRAIGARDLKIYTNYSWGKTREVCIFWLPAL